LNAHRIEAAWRLGSWDSLENLLKDEYEPRFEASIGSLLHSIAQGEADALQTKIALLKDQISSSFASAVTGTYAQSYEGSLRLHMLEDIDRWHKVLPERSDSPQDLRKLMQLFNARLDMTIPSHRIQEPQLDLGRALLCAM
jgi:serine/threonine-protein kinase ATR